jgi:hypothetical protein
MKMIKNTPEDQSQGPQSIPTTIQQSVVAVLVFAALAGSVWAIGAGSAQYRLTKAEAQLKKGYAQLAVETLEPCRAQLTSTTHGCQILVQVYASARRTDRLEWATQACMEAGVEFSEPSQTAENTQTGEAGRGLASPPKTSAGNRHILSPATPPRSF